MQSWTNYEAGTVGTILDSRSRIDRRMDGRDERIKQTNLKGETNFSSGSYCIPLDD